MRHHTGAWLHLQDLGPQLQIKFGQQIHRDDIGRAEIFFENIARDDAHLVLHTSLSDLAASELSHVGVEFNAHGIGLEFLCGRNRDDAVTRTQVIHPILRRDFGHGQHFVDQFGGRGDPHHVFATLAA